MTPNQQKAFDELKAIGAPVFDRGEQDTPFHLSGEENYDKTWADYWSGPQDPTCDDFGVNKEVNAILDKHGLFAEWENPGCLGVYDK